MHTIKTRVLLFLASSLNHDFSFSSPFDLPENATYIKCVRRARSITVRNFLPLKPNERFIEFLDNQQIFGSKIASPNA